MIYYATQEWLREPRWPYLRRSDIRRGLKVVVHPSEEPIDMETARAHLRIEADGSPLSHPDDALIQNVYLPAAREACENYAGRAFAPQTLELSLSAVPYGCRIELPMAPLLGVDSFTYLDTGGASQTFTGFDADTYAEPGAIELALNSMWPSTGYLANAVIVRYQVGYALPGSSPDQPSLPALAKQAILLTLTYFYSGSACEDIPPGAKALLDLLGRLNFGMA